MSTLRVHINSQSCSYRKRNYGLKGRVEMLFAIRNSPSKRLLVVFFSVGEIWARSSAAFGDLTI